VIGKEGQKKRCIEHFRELCNRPNPINLPVVVVVVVVVVVASDVVDVRASVCVVVSGDNATVCVVNPGGKRYDCASAYNKDVMEPKWHFFFSKVPTPLPILCYWIGSIR
jgi:hypothetical protein